MNKKVYLVVNSGSKWGLTGVNYKELVQIDESYGPKGLQILMFPSNSFNQEPLDEQGIQKFSRDKWGAKFFISEKIDVNGPSTHPAYVYLRWNSDLATS